ncbi:MAG TPA: TetR family transcriptional regulator [Pseudonocardiaceae bacterium]|nr:TetR family transcriptional regulator [Pseudonocardiaceae bacterium]
MKSLAEGHQPVLAEQPAIGRPTIGLRERKKAKTRSSIRAHAMRLFRELGYAETTVEKIAEAAEVSPSTFFRYFPTKEDLVVTDDYDPLLIAAFRTQPAELSVTDALRASVRAVFSTMDEDMLARESQRFELLESLPELHAARFQEYRRSIELIAELIAERLGRDPEEFEVRAFAGALVGVMMSVIRYDDDRNVINEGLFGRVDEALAYLEAGLPLPARKDS